MLIVPLSGKITWQNPPWMTIGLILINCFVFFLVQRDEDSRYAEAMSFYFESGLARIETSAYLTYLETRTGEKNGSLRRNQQKMDSAALVKLYGKMQRDREFLQKLHRGEIIRAQDDRYETWKELRRAHEERLSRVISHRYGFSPARMNVLNAFTYMFLHGGFMHLFGNMIFLWLVGCVLEVGWGRSVYAGTYLVTGLCAAALFALLNRGSPIPLVGASGAISGIIGAYMVSYGKSRIKVFYSLGFYFDYVKVRAIFLLPAWIAQELLQLFFGPESGVAYVAHVGGLASGALLAFLNLKVLGKVDREVFAEDPKERTNALHQEALRRMEELDMNGARQVLNRILEIDPADQSALIRLYQIAKLNPQSQAFQETAARLLSHLSTRKEAHEELYKIYKDYCLVSKSPRINLDLLFRISAVFTASGLLEESERIMALLLRRAPKSDKLPAGLLQLARSYLKKGMGEKGRKCLQVISRRFPESAESRIARGLLKPGARH